MKDKEALREVWLLAVSQKFAAEQLQLAERLDAKVTASKMA